MRKLPVCLLLLVLAACASAPPAPRITYYDPQAAAARILELAGDSAPPEVELAPSYLEMWQRTSVSGGPWVCTGGRDLYGKTLLTLTRLDGNRFSGVWARADQCGHSSRFDIEGRYDDKYVHLHFAADEKSTDTAIRRYEIADGGRRLIEDENYSFEDGKPHRHVFARSGGRRGGDIYQTTDFLPGAPDTPEQLLAQARVDLARTKAQDKRRQSANSFNWGGFAAGMTGIIAGARAQQQQAIANNEQRRLALNSQLQQQADAHAKAQAAALAQLQANRQQANAQPVAPRAESQTRVAQATPQATQRTPPRAAQTPAVEPRRTTASAGVPVAGATQANATPALQPRHVFCSAHVRVGQGRTRWLVTRLVKVHRPTAGQGTYQDDLDFRAFVAQHYGERNSGTCDFRFEAASAAEMRARSLRNAESLRKNGNVVEIVHLTWAPRD